MTPGESDQHLDPVTVAWLTLQATPGLGSVRLARLEAYFGDPRVALDARDTQWQAAGMPAAVIAARGEGRSRGAAALESVRDWCAAGSNRLLLCRDQPGYPAQLNDLPDPPPLLFLVGNPDLLAQPQLAMVGSRHPTAGGRAHARAFGRHLARCGLVVVSGLAQGIDAEAHRGALEGQGGTIAVMGTGPDRIYPAAHRDLAHEIVARDGLLLSEFLPGTGPQREHFPRRNRLISGLSLGTLVVEAGLRSGSLITARLAAEQGREVFAIPGSVHNPLARGCHRLIRDGAKLVECADDILEELSPRLQGYLKALPGDEAGAAAEAPQGAVGDDSEYRQLLDCLGFDPLHVDALVECSGLTAEAVSSMLLMLELDGRVESLSGGRYQRSR
ncbi:MAG: DNA-processing protein DprA [Halothiobacillaceae bacterium]